MPKVSGRKVRRHDMERKIWVFSELYYPEVSGTGYHLTNIAEGLANYFSVSVLCAQPTYSSRGVRATWREVHSGVQIRRCPGTTFDKNVLLLRILNVVTLSLSVFFVAVKSLRRGDQVIVVTNPPTLPFLAAAACALRGAKCAVLIYDVYPEALVAAGIGSPGSPWVRFLDWLHRRLYRSVERVIVLGRDMRTLVQAKINRPGPPVVIIPNWADLSGIRPSSRSENPLLRELGLLEKFVIEYSGNMGRTHDLEGLVECARILKGREDVHFLFVGSGAKAAWLNQAVKGEGLKNVTILPPQPRDELHISFTACDIAVISFVPGMAGVSVPSRMYDVIAAGKPILAVADAESELALLIQEEGVGWVVETSMPALIAEAVVNAKSDSDALRHMGERARRAAEEKYSYDSVIQKFRTLLEEMSGQKKTEAHENRD